MGEKSPEGGGGRAGPGGGLGAEAAEDPSVRHARNMHLLYCLKTNGSI